LLRPPEPFTGADVLLVESTYGARSHSDDACRQDFADAITRTVDRGGSVLIPAFAVDRTEVILRTLHVLCRAGKVPGVPVLVDSPMALAALKVYQQAIASGDNELRADIIADGPDAIDPGQTCALCTRDESKTANQPAKPSVILSSSGMATGGRVLHHLKHMLPDKRNTVLIVGYAAEGTRAHKLAHGARAIKIHGQYVPVRAEVGSIEAFSAHADSDEVLAWLAACDAPAPCTTYVIHGEPPTATALRDRIDAELGWTTVVPALGERVLVGTHGELD
jgi:metallo-beta-lactamase family protein